MRINRPYREDNPNGDPDGPTRADVHKTFIESLGPVVIAKVSRLAQLRRTAWAESRAIQEETQALRSNIQQAEQRAAQIRVSPARGGKDEVSILEGRIAVMKQRMAILQNQGREPAQRAGATRQVLENTLKEIEQRFGGGINCQDLFEAMNWR